MSRTYRAEGAKTIRHRWWLGEEPGSPRDHGRATDYHIDKRSGKGFVRVLGDRVAYNFGFDSVDGSRRGANRARRAADRNAISDGLEDYYAEEDPGVGGRSSTAGTGRERRRALSGGERSGHRGGDGGPMGVSAGRETHLIPEDAEIAMRVPDWTPRRANGLAVRRVLDQIARLSRIGEIRRLQERDDR